MVGPEQSDILPYHLHQTIFPPKFAIELELRTEIREPRIENQELHALHSSLAAKAVSTLVA